VAARVGQRINEHAVKYGIEEFDVTLFGGDPLVRGARGVRDVVDPIRERVTDAQLNFKATTNGLKFGKDAELRDALEERGVMVGISLNGYQALHDSTRLHYDGSGTYDEVVNAIDTLRFEHPNIYAGLLCTLLDPYSDPILTHRTLESFRPPKMDYLLDHGRARHISPEDRADSYVYGEWLGHAFNEWCQTPLTEPVPAVRLFESIISLLRGEGTGASAQVSADSWATIAIATDGSIRNDPGFNGAYDGAASTGMNVFTHSIEQALMYPSFADMRLGKAALSQTCQDCELVDKCGGGFPAHRYWSPDPENNPGEYITELFKYPSAYCGDMKVLIEHIGKTLELVDASREE
jgi:uncharacterized protein